MTTNSAQYLSTLHKQIDQYFSFSEVRTLCFNLGVDYENIPGDHRSAFIRNLIVSLAKQGRLQELIKAVRAERPLVDWQNVPADFELPKAMAQESIQQVVHYNVYGDYVGGDKIQGDKVSGDKISVGNIENAQGIAIGRGSSASVQTGESSFKRPSSPQMNDPAVQQAIERVHIYLQMVPPENREELTEGLTPILQQAMQQPRDVLHLKLLCLGYQQLTQALGAGVPGLDEVVAQFVTAVQNQ